MENKKSLELWKFYNKNPDCYPETFEEKLVYLIEEAAEVQKAATKILRFGVNGKNPNSDSVGNLNDLCDEIIDLELAVTLITDNIDDFLSS